MEGLCPRCQVRLELPESGTYECERCRTRFEVTLGSPRALSAPVEAVRLPSAWFPPAAGASAAFTGGDSPLGPRAGGSETAVPQHAPCASHPGNLAAQLCDRCGDFMCALCTTPVEGRLYCPRCFDLLYRRGALHFTQRQFTLPGLTLGLGITSMLLSWACVNLPFAAAGIFTGVKALQEHHRRPDLPNRKLTHWGLGLNAASLVVSVAVGLLFMYKIRR